MTDRRREEASSLIELLLVVVVIGFLGLLIANVPNSVSLITKSKHQSLVREIASKQIEDKRATAYQNLTNGQEEISDSRLSLLPGSSGQIITSDCDILVCTHGELVKQIQVTIIWKDSGKSQQVKLETLIAEGGLNQ